MAPKTPRIDVQREGLETRGEGRGADDVERTRKPGHHPNLKSFGAVDAIFYSPFLFFCLCVLLMPARSRQAHHLSCGYATDSDTTPVHVEYQQYTRSDQTGGDTTLLQKKTLSIKVLLWAYLTSSRFLECRPPPLRNPLHRAVGGGGRRDGGVDRSF